MTLPHICQTSAPKVNKENRVEDWVADPGVVHPDPDPDPSLRKKSDTNLDAK